VLVIDASLETRFNRLAGVGLLRDAALARMRAQLPRDRLLDAADVVIENDGSIEELDERIREFWTERVSGGRNDT
jgi:dephospho-CoA kinase